MNLQHALGLGLLVLSFTGNGQSVDSNTPEKKVYLNSVLGIAAPGFASLNTDLKQAGFLPLSSVLFARGAGFYTIFPQARLATIFNFSSYSGTNTEPNLSSWVRGTTAGTSLGFVIRNTDRLQLIPYAGLVYSWFGTRLSRVAPTSTAFNGYLTGPANQHHLALEQFLVNVGLHLVKPSLGRSALAQKLLIGVRAGYLTPLNQPSWKSNDITLNGGPTVNPGGLYAHLIFGSSL